MIVGLVILRVSKEHFTMQLLKNLTVKYDFNREGVEIRVNPIVCTTKKNYGLTYSTGYLFNSWLYQDQTRKDGTKDTYDREFSVRD